MTIHPYKRDHATALAPTYQNVMKHYPVIRWLPLAAAAVLAAACSEQESAAALATDPVAVLFDVPLVETRAGYTGELDMQSLKEHNPGFGVYAYYTGTEKWTTYATTDNNTDGKIYPNFLYNQRVVWSAAELWTYEPLKYWPNGEGKANDDTGAGETPHHVSFFAYAPQVGLNITNTAEANDPTTDPTANITHINGSSLTKTDTPVLLADNSKATILAPTIDYRLSGTGDNVDLLWATPQIDMTKQAINEKVPFTFHHALAALRVMVQRVYNGSATSLPPDNGKDTKILISSLALEPQGTWYVSRRLNLGDGSWTNLEAGTTEEAKTVMTFTGNDIDVRVRGVQADLSAPMTETERDAAILNIRNNELNKWSTLYDETGTPAEKGDIVGVIDEARALATADKSLVFIPQGTVTLMPHLTYSFITQDNTLQLNYLTDREGNRYSRIYNDIEAPTFDIEMVAGKKYTLICLVGVESVEFKVQSIEDWDFPLRFVPSIPDAQHQSVEVPLDEE